MQRNPMQRRRDTHRDAQPSGGAPRADHEPEDLQDAEVAPSFLTARELQAREPSKAQDSDGAAPLKERREDKPRKGKTLSK